jgi:hypothetical protein
MPRLATGIQTGFDGITISMCVVESVAGPAGDAVAGLGAKALAGGFA